MWVCVYDFNMPLKYPTWFRYKAVRYSFWGLLLTIGAGILAIVFSHFMVEWYASYWVFDDVKKVPHNRVALILGTSSRLADGSSNLYFKYRIQAAVQLYKAKKADYLLVSGDNSLAYYNEPMDMKKALMKEGIPENIIFLDYAGFRTLDSVIRANKVFAQAKYTIVSQPFHNKRALFIARQRGINAVAYNARDVSASLGFKTQMRELLARVNVVLDIYILNTQPKFLGEIVDIL